MKIRDDNYFTVKGWMLNRLGLKGTQLLLYAVIYGFSQDGQSAFKGAVGYLAEFAGVTETSARSNLNALVEKGLIIKTAGASGDVNSYAVNIAKIAQNNGDLSAGDKNIPAQPKNAAKRRYVEDVEQITAYLNKQTGKNYKPSAYDTYSHIQARLNEGFTVADFKRVIDTKVAEWRDNEKMCVYLRPSTLFGTKFQSYLNQEPRGASQSGRSYDLEAVKNSATQPIIYHKKQK